MADAWGLFPLPTASKPDGRRGLYFQDGSFISSSPDCVGCPTFECWTSVPDRAQGYGECRYGLNFVRLDDNRMIVGVLVNNGVSATRRAKSRSRKEPERRVTKGQIDSAVDRAKSLGPGVVEDFERHRRATMKRLTNDPELYKIVADNLRADFADNVGKSHDLVQLVKLIKGYSETLLQHRYPTKKPAEAAELMATEGAIYFASELMLGKLDALKYLDEPNQVFALPTRFSIHPYVLKYVRIYRWEASQKELDLKLAGECYASCNYNSDAIGAISREYWIT